MGRTERDRITGSVSGASREATSAAHDAKGHERGHGWVRRRGGAGVRLALSGRIGGPRRQQPGCRMRAPVAVSVTRQPAPLRRTSTRPVRSRAPTR